MNEEAWLPVVGFEQFYEISNLGRVCSLRFISTRGPAIMKSGMSRGYSGIILYKEKKAVRLTIHRMVMEALVGSRPLNYDINHKNGIKHDNRLENLEYVTKSENRKHAFRIGLQSNQGINHSRAKLNDEKVRRIRLLISLGVSRKQIAMDMGVTTACISGIKSGRNWSHVTS